MGGTKGFTPAAKPHVKHRFAAKDLPAGCERRQALRHEQHGPGRLLHENDLYAEQFQAALENDDGERFDALCFLAGGGQARDVRRDFRMRVWCHRGRSDYGNR
ncbi:hypothetical protein CYMTET_33355 [Cymbomonas tetramitiformis]|uniref:Uncharacterized protein n=1 Tax=Cymbomonas tetramitiformis TaxID=36881 RepID=A0AAE0FDU4_9CHLO|nr:hypothetical protein CYMTET_33355 [Cymbomonas tetramitiformis]